MLLVLDIGNTNIKTGLFEGDVLKNSWRMTTEFGRTSDEYGVMMESFFAHIGIATGAVTGVMISSVLPSINYTIEHMCNLYFPKANVMMVSNALKLGIVNKYDNPEMLGSDRICNCAAAYHKYGGDCVVVDFGTATSFNVISAEGEFIGGLICPGIRVASEALTLNAAMLPNVELTKPDRVICSNTVDAIRSGIFHGYVGLVEGILKRITQELGRPMRAVATGGMSDVIAAETDCFEYVNPILTLEGLALIYQMNEKSGEKA